MAELVKKTDEVYQITERGREVLANPPPVLDRKYLSRFSEYVAAQKKLTSPNDPITSPGTRRF